MSSILQHHFQNHITSKMISQHLAIMSAPPRRQNSVGTLATLWHTKEGSDVTIRCGDGVELKVHRLVLNSSPWMASTLEMQRASPYTETNYLQLGEHSSIVRPMVALLYGVELPPLKKGPRTETQLRTLLDIYHINYYKYHIPKLQAICEAALANPGNTAAESPSKIGQKSPMHGVISRMLGHQREGRLDTIREDTGMCNPGKRVANINDCDPFVGDCDRQAITIPGASHTGLYVGSHPLNEYHLALLEDDRERRDSVISDASTTSDAKGKVPADARHSGLTSIEPERQGIAIPGVPHMARLRDRSPGGTPYSSPRLYHEIMAMLGSDGEPSPMLYSDLPSSRPVVERLSDDFQPDSPNSKTPWGLSMSPLLDDSFSPSEDTLHLVPSPLRPARKRRTNSSGTSSSSFYGPRPLQSGSASQRSVTMQELGTKTLAHQQSQASLRDGVFSSLRGATRRAFTGKSKR